MAHLIACGSCGNKVSSDAARAVGGRALCPVCAGPAVEAQATHRVAVAKAGARSAGRGLAVAGRSALRHGPPIALAILGGLLRAILWALACVAGVFVGLFGQSKRTLPRATEPQIDYLVDLYRKARGQTYRPEDFADWNVRQASDMIGQLKEELGWTHE